MISESNAPIALAFVESMKVKCKASDMITIWRGKIKTVFDGRLRDSPLGEKRNTLGRLVPA
jgi:hypothetical protein